MYLCILLTYLTYPIQCLMPFFPSAPCSSLARRPANPVSTTGPDTGTVEPPVMGTGQNRIHLVPRRHSNLPLSTLIPPPFTKNQLLQNRSPPTTSTASTPSKFHSVYPQTTTPPLLQAPPSNPLPAHKTTNAKHPSPPA